MSSLRYLYQAGSVFAVYKPAGVHSVGLPNGRGGASIADLLIASQPALASVGRSPEDAGLIQRLDLSTSGILLGATSRAAWELLFEQLGKGEVQKLYVACVEGVLREPQEVSSFIGSPYRGAQKMKSFPTESPRALFGQTRFEPLSVEPSQQRSLVIARASPARRHQVRVHAAQANHPLVGDALYGATTSLQERTSSEREFFLHSWRTSFRHPESKEDVLIESPLSDEIDWAGTFDSPS